MYVILFVLMALLRAIVGIKLPELRENDTTRMPVNSLCHRSELTASKTMLLTLKHENDRFSTFKAEVSCLGGETN
jgi:hypothetical protein